MADLRAAGSTGSDRRGVGRGLGDSPGDRGQVILVAAFAVAVTLVTLALVLNSAIYTENLATRTESSGATDALTYRHSVQHDVGSLLERANDVHADDRTAIESSVDTGVTEYGELSGGQQALSGATVSLAYQSETDGVRVYQDADGAFTNDSSSADWTVASEVDDTRQFRINASTSPLALPGGPAYRVVVNDTSTADPVDWRMNVTKNGTNHVKVGIENGTGESTCLAGSGLDSVWINVTEGTVAGERCDGLTFAEGVSGEYNVSYENGLNVEGTYSLIVERPSATSTGDAPNDDRVLYSVLVGLAYETHELEYETTVRVAPGEPDA